jgi:hypothetical protein
MRRGGRPLACLLCFTVGKQHLKCCQMAFMESFGFTSQDILFLFYCSAFAALGGMANVCVLWADYSKLPDEGSFIIANLRVACIRIFWIFIRVQLSCVVGLIFSLFLVGALNSNSATTARIFALSILIGYAAPKLLVTQEALISEAVENKLRKILQEKKKEQASPQS